MASDTKKHHHHLRINSDPAHLTGWHAQHRSLSLTARMHANIHLPSSSTLPDYPDTGFPEPLSPDRNTTMRHPDADTSPNATIEAQDIDIARTRHRYSFLRERHRIRSGKIAPETSLTTLTNINTDTNDNLIRPAKRSDSGYESAQAAEKDAPVGFLPESGGLTASPLSSRNNSMVNNMRHSEDLVLEKTRTSTGSMETTRKRGFLGRLHSLRHRSEGSKG